MAEVRRLTHMDSRGRARMVDVADKPAMFVVSQVAVGGVLLIWMGLKLQERFSAKTRSAMDDSKARAA